MGIFVASSFDLRQNPSISAPTLYNKDGFMAGFTNATYANLITQQSETQQRLFAQYTGGNNHFDVAIVGSGMGGGILADHLADNSSKRILVLEAGSYLFPTHVYNTSRLPNADVARKYGVQTFSQGQDSRGEHYIYELPQLNFGGRSIFWSGLIPSPQSWELDFFPQNVRGAISSRLADAGRQLNVSTTLGRKSQEIVGALRQTPLAHHFEIQETPRALHQPYLTSAGMPGDEFWIESTGVFNTAELLINQVGLNPGNQDVANAQKLQLLLNHFVEIVERQPNGIYRLSVKDTLANQPREFTANTVVLAAGSIESPKIVRRSPIFDSLATTSKDLVGRGLTDHPTTDWLRGLVTHIGGIDIPRNSHAKIIFYSKGRRNANGSIVYPFNVEMNINHEYWHLRENDPTNPQQPIGSGHESRMEIKFSFGNFLDDRNRIELGATGQPAYVPQIRFKNLHRVDDLAQNRFNALAGWNKTVPDIWWDLNGLAYQIFSQFKKYGVEARPDGNVWYGEGGKGFGGGTVHHAVGTLRMPNKSRFDTPQFNAASVVDENLMVLGHPSLYVCDMSVMPYSSSANPVLALAALALRLSERIISS